VDHIELLFTCVFYFLTIVDDYSCVVWIYLLAYKRVERQIHKQIKIFRSDNETEFTCMKIYFLDRGIIFQTSCTGIPQQNGRVERNHRHILNVVRALRFQGNLPIIKFSRECILTATYLINRTPSTILNGKILYQMLHGQQPAYEHLRIFGFLCYVHNQRRNGDKFASRIRSACLLTIDMIRKGGSCMT